MCNLSKLLAYCLVVLISLNVCVGQNKIIDKAGSKSENAKIIVNSVAYTISVCPAMNCDSFNSFWEEAWGTTRTINDSDTVSLFLGLLDNAHISQEDLAVDVRAKIYVLYDNFVSDTFCFGDNFKNQFIKNGVCKEFNNSEAFETIKSLIWRW